MPETALMIIEKAGLPALPDKGQWTHRMEIRSQSSGRLYIVSKNKSTGVWGCSCPGWRTHRNCKHLREIVNITDKIDVIDGIGTKDTVRHNATQRALEAGKAVKEIRDSIMPVKREPKSEKARAALKERVRRSFTDEAYNHYDTSTGFGSPEEWRRIADDLFGRVRENPNDQFVYSEGKRKSAKRNKWLEALRLEDMPLTLALLKKAARGRMMETHPDRGGNADEFREVFAAYEKLAMELFGVKV